ncbi:adenosylcobinamide-GDP ribazoletransferase [Phenylobacterium sp.]|jgi:adenosylcobinamide-GDP ribazoletransferase|uniref:adenosylcobinamide-GDP ribazoletransferase n=1 Tax=Phenylobacterium sp. TaxID=1871053 RepID=UPI002F40F692
MRRQLQLVACAVQFLTRVPMPAQAGFEPGWITRSARYFPLVGQGVGAISAAAWLAGLQVWPPALAALVAVGLGILVTGAFHEDGLADTADGLGGGRTPERRLEIMKDSRVGTYGVLALGLVVALRVAALTSLSPGFGAVALVAGHGAARATAVMAMRATPYAGDRDAAKWTPSPAPPGFADFAVAGLIAVWPFAFMPPAATVAGLGPALVAAWLTMLLARRLVGGHTGDVLGAVEQVFEATFLVGLAAVFRPG